MTTAHREPRLSRSAFRGEEDPAVLRAHVPYVLLLPPTEEELAALAKKKAKEAPCPRMRKAKAKRRSKGRRAVEEEEVGTRVPWVTQFDIDTSLTEELLGGIRDSFVTSVEVGGRHAPQDSRDGQGGQQAGVH